MARIAGVDLSNKHVVVALTYIYGTGRSSAKAICEKTKIDPDSLKDVKKTESVEEKKNKIRKVLDVDPDTSLFTFLTQLGFFK